MHENIDKIFQHIRQVVIDAIKTYVAAQPNQTVKLPSDKHYRLNDDLCVITTMYDYLVVNNDERLYCDLYFGKGYNPAEWEHDCEDVETFFSMNELYEIIKSL